MFLHGRPRPTGQQSSGNTQPAWQDTHPGASAEDVEMEDDFWAQPPAEESTQAPAEESAQAPVEGSTQAPAGDGSQPQIGNDDQLPQSSSAGPMDITPDPETSLGTGSMKALGESLPPTKPNARG